jgi:apolipoprotein D and lipocalin family protein
MTTTGDGTAAVSRWKAGLAAGVVSGLAVVALLTTRSRRARHAPPTVEHVDLERYAGRWFEIARLPNDFQQDCVRDVTAHYAPLPDGRVRVTNQCVLEDGTLKRADAVARLATDDGSNAKLKVRFAPAVAAFLPFVWGDYWVLDLSADYAWAVVGGPDRRFLWILSRTPDLPSPLYHELLRRAAVKGYDTARVVKTRQTGVR